MIYDVGDAVTLSTTVKDAAGTLTDATMAIAVTRPDGTAGTPSGPTKASTGVYTAVVTADQAGRWRYTWTASGAVVAVEPGQFDVQAATAAYVASLQELKQQLNRSDDTDDAELRGYLASATRYVEWRLGGPVTPTTYTERHYVLGDIIPRRRPLVSVTSLTPDLGSGAIDPAAYAVDTDLGQVTLLRSIPYGWYVLVYVAGGAPSASAKLSGLIVAQHLWQTQQGFGARPYPSDDVVMTGLGFAVPRRAEELLAGEQTSGVA